MFKSSGILAAKPVKAGGVSTDVPFIMLPIMLGGRGVALRTFRV